MATAEGNQSFPFLTATVLVVLISAGAGFFAWSYTYAFANPTPREVPVAVVGWEGTLRRAFVAGMDQALDGALVPHPAATYARAREAVEEQTAFAILDLQRGRWVTVDVKLAAVIVGFVGAIQLNVHARGLDPGVRIGFTVGCALLGTFAHTEVYFPGHSHGLPFVVLAGWAAVSTCVFWVVWQRQARAGKVSAPGALQSRS
ncbi:hypothetical protein ACWDWO_05960 [Actinopolymorpha singaporensis]